MKYLVFAAVLLSTGCVNQTYARAVESGLNAIGPEYEQYIMNDATLSPTTKRIRLDTLKDLKKLTAEALK